MASDPVRLLARGAAVTLADGSEHHLVIDLEALCAIEERAGSLLTFLDWGRAGFRGKALNYVRTGLVAGLAHEGLSERQIVALIDHRDLDAMRSLLDAVAMAVDEALPKAEEAPASGKESRRRSASTGTTSTTSEPSSSAEATGSSGE